MYATQTDISNLYGAELLYQLADRDRDQVLDTVAITTALEAATGEIDSKLSVRYSVPFAAPSADLRRICVDIACYRLAQQADALTVEIKDRYEMARDDLLLMAAGKIGTGIPPDPATPTSEIRGGEVLVSGNDRAFTRESLRGL